MHDGRQVGGFTVPCVNPPLVSATATLSVVGRAISRAVPTNVRPPTGDVHEPGAPGACVAVPAAGVGAGAALETPPQVIPAGRARRRRQRAQHTAHTGRPAPLRHGHGITRTDTQTV